MYSLKSLRIIAIIQARLTSTRLPKKVLKKIRGKSLIDRVIERVKKSKLINEVIVASPHFINYDATTALFVGDETDVLKRYYDCAEYSKADIIVRITSDCPLIDPEIIDYAIEYMVKKKLPYVCFAPIDGLDVEVFTFEMLKKAFENTKDSYDREHVTPYMKRATKLSVDTKADLEKVRRYVKEGRI